LQRKGGNNIVDNIVEKLEEIFFCIFFVRSMRKKIEKEKKFFTLNNKEFAKKL